MRIACYARVSTADQVRGLEGQLDQLRAYAEARGAEPVVFTDETSGAAKAHRPGLDALLDAVHRRQVDAVACVRLDRLARSVAHLVRLGADLDARGVALIVLEQAIDTGTSTGRLLFHVLSSIAEFERDLIKERTKAGLAAARRRGARIGRPPVLDRQKVARVRRLRAAGKSLRAIAALLDCGVATVRRALA